MCMSRSNWDQQDLHENFLQGESRGRPIGDRSQNSSANFHAQRVMAPLQEGSESVKGGPEEMALRGITFGLGGECLQMQRRSSGLAGGRETEQATFSGAHVVQNSLSLRQKRRKPWAEQPGTLFCHYHRQVSKRRPFRCLCIGEPLLFQTKVCLKNILGVR